MSVMTNWGKKRRKEQKKKNNNKNLKGEKKM